MAKDRTQAKRGDGGRRGGGPRALAASLGGVSKRTLGRRGFAEGGLIADWTAVVGPELAASCWPDRLSFPPGKKDGGVLRICIAGGFAIELQHLAPQVLERINGHFGYRAIERISILQAPPATPKGSQRAATKHERSQSDPMLEADVAAVLSEIQDPDIRAALARLGRAMISDGRTDDSG